MPLTVSVGAAAAFAAFSIYSHKDDSSSDLPLSNPNLHLDASASEIDDESGDLQTRSPEPICFRQQMDQAGVTQIDEPVASATARALIESPDRDDKDHDKDIDKDASVYEPYCELSPITKSEETGKQGWGWGWGWFYKS